MASRSGAALDSDDEFENALFASMESDCVMSLADGGSLHRDEELARALQEEEYKQEPQRRGPASGACLFARLPDELVSRVFSSVSVATLLTSVRLASWRCSALATSEVHERTGCQLFEATVAGFASDEEAAAAAAAAVVEAAKATCAVDAAVPGATIGDSLFAYAAESPSSSDTSVSSSNSAGASSTTTTTTTAIGNTASASATAATVFKPLSDADRGRLRQLCAQLEAALCRATPAPSAFSKRVRSFCFNLRDKKNPELRRKLLDGSVTPPELVCMSIHDMASSLQKAQKAAFHARSLKRSIKNGSGRELGHLTDLYLCDSCGSKSTRVHRVIRPGRAIDRAKSYATCSECSARWEV